MSTCQTYKKPLDSNIIITNSDMRGAESAISNGLPQNLLLMPAKTISGESTKLSPKILRFARMSDEVFHANWDAAYGQIWDMADCKREKGDYDGALEFYREAQALVKEATEKNVPEDVIHLRNSFLHYMILQCYANIHKSPDLAMREFHNFGHTLYKFILHVLEGFPEREEVKSQLDALYGEDSYVSIHRIQQCLSGFYKNNAERLSDRQLEIVWKCAYSITRFAGSIHDYFIKSTSLINLGKKYYRVCDEASRIAIDSSNAIPAEKIEGNVSLERLKKLTDEWLDGYTEFLADELDHILGSEEADTTKNKKTKSTLTMTEARYLRDDLDVSDPSVKKSLEFTLQNSIRRIFDSVLRDNSKYKQGIEQLQRTVDRCEKFGFTNLVIQANIFICRSALREGEINDAKAALEVLKLCHLEPSDKIGAESTNYERWYALLDAEIKLREYSAEASVSDEMQEVRDHMSDLELSIDAFKPHVRIGNLQDIEKIFDRYKHDTKEKLPKLSFKPLDAKIYYMLGLVAIEKMRILGAEYNSLPDEPEPEEGESDKTRAGKELHRATGDAKAYLCEAHAILDNLDYKGTRLKNKISASLQEMVDLNKSILGSEKRDADKAVAMRNAEQEKPVDMDHIVKDSKVKKCADLLFDFVSANDLSAPDDGFEDLSTGLQMIFQKIDSIVCSTNIVEGLTANEMHQDAIDRFKKNQGEKERFYYIHTPEGKVIEVFSVDEENDRFVLLEVNMKLTGNARGLIAEILKGVKYFLRLKDSAQKLEDAGTEENEELVLEYAENLTELYFNLISKHPPTIKHSLDVGRMMFVAAQKINEQHESNLNPKIAEYAGILHDIGKVFSSTLILDAPRKLESFEYRHIQQHVQKGLQFLKKVKAFEYVPELALYSGSHHVRYANDFGYPFNAPGSKIKEIPQMINELLGLTDDDPDSLQGELTHEQALLARAMNIIDVTSAMRAKAKDRKYRDGPEPIGDFLKTLISRAGTDYDPEAVVLMFRVFKDREIGEIIGYDDTDRRYLQNVEGPKKAYTWSEIADFFKTNQAKFEDLCGVGLDYAFGVLAKNSVHNLTLTRQAVGRLLCENMIQQMGYADAAREKYKKDVEAEFVDTFRFWLE